MGGKSLILRQDQFPPVSKALVVEVDTAFFCALSNCLFNVQPLRSASFSAATEDDALADDLSLAERGLDFDLLFLLVEGWGELERCEGE